MTDTPDGIQDGGGVYLVPGRECGACTACCRDLAIAEDGLDKLPGIPCRHCTKGQGCAIYAARPNVCRSYNCLWRSLPNLAEHWRPDRSGILIANGVPPPGYPGEHAVELMLVGKPKQLFTDDFAGLAAGFIESGTATFLNVAPGVGYVAFHYLLNERLAAPIAARNLAGVKAGIRAVYTEIAAQKPVRATPDTIRQALLHRGSRM